MGTTTSSTASPRKARLEYLGDRYPFGDAELVRLAHCHAHLRRGRRLRRSFLSDWAVFSASLPPSQPAAEDANIDNGNTSQRGNSDGPERHRRAALLQVVEGRILPSGFGRRLERAAFLLQTDVVDYHTSSAMMLENDHDGIKDNAPGEDPYRGSVVTTAANGDEGGRGLHILPAACQPCWSPGHAVNANANAPNADTNTSPQIDQDYGQVGVDFPDPLAGTAADDNVHQDESFRRLEKFIEGASDCCRRGSRPALTVLFKSCSRNSRGGYTSDMRVDTTAGVGVENGMGDTNGNGVDATNGFEGGGFDTFAATTNDNDPTNIWANANEVLDLGYSLALASAFLSEAAQIADLHELDANAYIPDDVGTAMSKSLLAYAKKRRQEYQTHQPPPLASGELDLDPYTRKSLSVPAESRFSERSAGSISSTSTNVHGNENLVTLDVFLEWAEQTAPCLSACLSTFLHHVLFPDKPYPPSRTPFLYPNLDGQQSAFFESPSSPLLFSLACMSPSLGGSWHRLYTSESDGLSFNRLFSCLLGYGGPTLLIIREAEGGGVFGAFTSTAWKESKNFYGNSDCFLFQVSPSVGVYRPRGRGTNYMYCNSVARSRGYDGLAHGIGFGGTDELPRLFIAETFDGCVASSADLTFEPGPLLPPAKEGGARKYFSICDLEVWGVGGDEAVASGLDARKAQRAILDANIQKARRVDKAQFLDDFKSGLIESKAFKHRTEARGRHDFEADDNDGKDGGQGYKIPPDKRGSVVVPGRTIPGTGL